MSGRLRRLGGWSEGPCRGAGSVFGWLVGWVGASESSWWQVWQRPFLAQVQSCAACSNPPLLLRISMQLPLRSNGPGQVMHTNPPLLVFQCFNAAVPLSDDHKPDRTLLPGAFHIFLHTICPFILNLQIRPFKLLTDAAVPLSDDHKPDRPDERDRVEAKGGSVVWAGTWRVSGVLAVSRSFGNRMMKHLIIPHPEIREDILHGGEAGGGYSAWR